MASSHFHVFHGGRPVRPNDSKCKRDANAPVGVDGANLLGDIELLDVSAITLHFDASKRGAGDGL